MTVSFHWPPEGGRRVHATVGFDPRTAMVRELFLRGGGQTGSERDLTLDDVAVLVSILLQSGYSPVDLRARLGRLPSGEPATIIGAALDLAVEIEADILGAKTSGDEGGQCEAS